MKLRNLNGLIRKSEGPPKLNIVTEDGVVVVSLVKADLMKGLAAVWPDSMAETGLALNEDGFLVSEAHGDRFAPAPTVYTIPAGFILDDATAGNYPPGEYRTLTGDGSGIALPEVDPDELLGDGPSTFDDDDLDGLLG